MSGEGEIKMKKSRSSGEVRRQQHLMRPAQTDDESEEKQNSSDLKEKNCRAEELVVQLKTLCLMISRWS